MGHTLSLACQPLSTTSPMLQSSLESRPHPQRMSLLLHNHRGCTKVVTWRRVWIERDQLKVHSCIITCSVQMDSCSLLIVYCVSSVAIYTVQGAYRKKCSPCVCVQANLHAYTCTCMRMCIIVQHMTGWNTQRTTDAPYHAVCHSITQYTRVQCPQGVQSCTLANRSLHVRGENTHEWIWDQLGLIQQRQG